MRFEVIARKQWRHMVNGRTASIYGACPWFNDNDKPNWQIVQNGFTIRDNGLNQVGGQHALTKIDQMNRAEVQNLADKLNGKRESAT